MIKTFGGVKKPFYFEPTDTILQIKQTLEEMSKADGIDVPANMLELWHDGLGKFLQDDQILSHYSITPGDTIHMIFNDVKAVQKLK